MRPARIFAIISAIYLLVTSVYYIAQRDYMFHPSTLRVPPKTIGLAKTSEIELRTDDGQTLIAWYAPPETGQPTLYYLHGNAGALFHRASRIRLYRAHGYGIFLLAYRGFSGSTGEPSEAAIVSDALLAYDYLAKSKPSQSEIVIYGESLGTGVAVQVAAMRQPAGMILESPFSSAADVGAHLYPFLPVHLLLKDRFESVRYISKVKAPLLMLHGERDSIVPVDLGRKLFAAATSPKQAYFLAEATHYTLYDHGAFEKIKDFLNRFSIWQKLPPGTIPISCHRCSKAVE